MVARKNIQKHFRELADFMVDRMAASAVAVSLALALFLTVPGEGAAFRNLEKGKPLPDFTLKDLAGMSHTFSAEKGKVVILGFVRIDQDRSIKTLNALEEIDSVFKEDGVTVWAITSQAEDTSAIRSLVEKLSLDYPILVDEDQKLYGQYGLFTFPVTAIADREGNFDFEYSSYSGDYKEIILNKAKVLLGLISEDEFESSTEKTELVEHTPEQKEAERNLQTAKVLLMRGFGTKALPRLEKALELDPSLMEARNLSGEIYLEEEQYEQARVQFEKVLELDPNNNQAKIGISSVYIAQGNLDEAQNQLQSAIALNPDPTLALYRLGQVYEKKGDSQKAMEVYRDALERLLKKSGKK